MAEERIMSYVNTFFDISGLEQSLASMRDYDTEVMRLTTDLKGMTDAYDNMVQALSRAPAPISIQPGMAGAMPPTPQPMMTEQWGRPMGGGMKIDESALFPRGPSIAEYYESGMEAARNFQGVVSNLAHMYYWQESAQLRLENAQTRLAQAQDNYTAAVAKWGSESQQAIRTSRSMEIAENNLARAHAREILNYGLLGTQLVMMVGRLGELAKSIGEITALTATEAAAHRANALAKLASMMATPYGLAFAAIAGAAVIGLVAQSTASSEAEKERQRVKGYPQAQGGARILESGPIMAHRDELILTPEQQRQRVRGYPQAQGGARILESGPIMAHRDELILTPEQQGVLGARNVTLRMGDIVIQTSPSGLEGSIDNAVDRQRWDVKNQLRRLIV